MNRSIFTSIAIATSCILSCSQPKPASDNVQDRIHQVEKNIFAAFHFPIKITKKDQGVVTEFLAFDKDVWVRDK